MDDYTRRLFRRKMPTLTVIAFALLLYWISKFFAA
jgi:hypothetical protein